MNPLLIGPILELGKGIIDRFLPDPAEKAKAELELFKMTQEAEMKEVLAQLEINAKEAQNPSIFVAGGRPFFMWVGGAGFGYAIILQPIFTWFARIQGWADPPEINIDLLWPVVAGLLGIGGLRSIEKVKGVSK